MRFTKFHIKNFKGIADVTVDLDKSPNSNIYTFVGLNESGKSTILEAINLFIPIDRDVSKDLSALDIPGGNIKDFNSIIPISKRDNFNDTITLEVTLKLEKGDLEKINAHTLSATKFKEVLPTDEIIYYRHYRFENSKFKTLDTRWSGFSGVLKTAKRKKYISIFDDEHKDDNFSLARFCRKLIPNILYFPNFLFDFPNKIYLESKNELAGKEKFYYDLIQDILYSLGNETNVKTHIIDRIKSSDDSDKKSLERLIQLMEKKVSEVVFGAWNRIFKKDIKDTRVVIKFNVDNENFPFLEFKIVAPDGIYQIDERSLGFRWFFVFLLFTQFRPSRKDSPPNTMFLFDEPASNLHSFAQQQLLKSFENITHNAKVIYTTHSHHLINPNWLESTYVVKNEGLEVENSENYNSKKTKIVIESYRDFASKHPHNTAYFQPILDVLEYVPSNLENLPNCVFLEGKNDFYTLTYFKEVILDKSIAINLAPSTGSGNLDTLISLYIAWGKAFIVFLDSDKEGVLQKKRYIEKFGAIMETRIFTFADVDSSWENVQMESLFGGAESLNFQKSCYPESTELNKSLFNRSMQEKLIKKEKFVFKEKTTANVEKVLDFLVKKLHAKLVKAE